MKIGILLADDVRDALQAEFGRYPGMFRALLDGGGAEFSYEVYDCRAMEFPRAADECDAYVISGSRHGVGDGAAWIAAMVGRLREIHAAGVPLAGICFGHQALAVALGGEVRRADCGWLLGLQEWEVFASAEWMRPRVSRLRAVVQLSGSGDGCAAGGRCFGGERVVSGCGVCGGAEFRGAGSSGVFPGVFAGAFGVSPRGCGRGDSKRARRKRGRGE